MVRAYSRSIRVIREPRPIGDGVCELELSQGLFGLIDETDANAVSVCSWCVSYNGRNPIPYVKGRPVRGGQFVRLHRYLLGFPDGVIDHANRNTLDNRRSNLRVVTLSQSSANTGLRRDSSTGFKGVNRYGSQFSAVLCGQIVGTFSTAIDAAHAYDHAALAHFGVFAATNASLGLLSEAVR